MALKVPQESIGQRLKFLLDHFGMSARTFGRTIGVPENNTQNYLGPRAMLPKADYLEKVVTHFQSVNARWLLTGQGEAFVPGVAEKPRAVHQRVKKNVGGQVITQVDGDAIYHYGASANDQTAIERELEWLRQQVADRDRTILDKERTIQILLGQHPKP